MSEYKGIASLMRENKTVVIFIAVALFLIELQIFAVAALQSGERYKLKLIDTEGNLVYETDGKYLNDFNPYHFEKVHGSIENYEKKLEKEDIPFPFRAWFVAAIAIPVGLVLCFAFVVKAYMYLFYGEKEKRDELDSKKTGHETRVEKIIGSISRFNIFVIGSIVFLAVISYWIIPNVVTYLGKTGINAIIRFKWFFLSACIVVVGLLVWIIYLKFLLAKRAMDSRVEIDKYRVQLEYKQNIESERQLEYRQNEEVDRSTIIRDDDDVIDVENVESHR